MDQFRPLLGASVVHLSQVKLPVFASYKLDGIRAIWYGKEFISRTLKTIPNRAIQGAFASLDLQPGWDGELIVGEPNASDVYRKTNSKCMTITGSADDVRFFVFDDYEAPGEFYQRIESIYDVVPRVIKLDQHLFSNLTDLEEFELDAIKQGYEGIVLRSPSGRYKFGRSTLREQYLLKVKRFKDAEAIIVDFQELQHNANELTRDERGYAKRSSHEEGLVPMGKLGAFVVEMGGNQFNIGTGFTELDRRRYWQDRAKLKGQLVKFKYFDVGIKDLPRHPVFLGLRSKIDT